MVEKPNDIHGVVTFLDVLGWKGVYDRQPDAIANLTRLIAGVMTRAKEQQRGRILREVVVKSISDTIAIFTFCADDETSLAIEIHGELCSWLIPASIDAELPMRGATAFGEFEVHENIFVGKAVDEAAAWHEQGDWIGIHLTPSAEFVFKAIATRGVWTEYSPPTKNRLGWKPHCVNWTRDWSDRPKEIGHIKNKFRQLGPIVPEIAGKFINTLLFVEAMNPEPEVAPAIRSV